MAKYRFKRLDEYDASEINTSRGIPVSWSLDMGFYMGADIPDEYNDNCDNNRGFGMSGWWFRANEYVKKEVVVNNIVIENTSIEHGQRIISYLNSLGINTRYRTGNNFDTFRFYGVIDGRFDNYDLETVRSRGASIIKLPEDQVSKTSDVVEYFNDLSQHIGRYLKTLVDSPNGGEVMTGEIGLIISSDRVDFPSQSDYCFTSALSKRSLNVECELMPEDYSPDLPSDSCVYDYVKCTNPSGWTHTVKANGGNLIFKTSEFDFSLVKVKIGKEWTWDSVLKHYEGGSWVKSIKEEYLSQFAITQKDEQIHSLVKSVSSISSVHNHKTFIEPVHSVNLKLRTKNKSIKF